MTELISPKNGAEVILHTKVQRDFRNQQHHTTYTGPINWEHPERSENEESTHPPKTVFTWSTDRSVSRFLLTESASGAVIADTETAGTSFETDNLKIGTKYRWRVNDSEEFTFTTDPTPPRFIRADSVSNVRDIGGWMTKHGRRMKQGVIYRCGRADDSSAHICQPDFDALGIVCEIDLRREMVGRRTESTFSSNMKYLTLPCDGYVPFLLQKSECKALMEAIADESNLPLVYHCIGGADRTGTLTLILQALCGVDEDDLFLDYELTTLSIWGERGRNNEFFEALVANLRAYGDENTPWDELAERFILDCGVEKETVEKIRKILLD